MIEERNSTKLTEVCEWSRGKHRERSSHRSLRGGSRGERYSPSPTSARGRRGEEESDYVEQSDGYRIHDHRI